MLFKYALVREDKKRQFESERRVQKGLNAKLYEIKEDGRVE
jgi:hypothetical protein